MFYIVTYQTQGGDTEATMATGENSEQAENNFFNNLPDDFDGLVDIEFFSEE